MAATVVISDEVGVIDGALALTCDAGWVVESVEIGLPEPRAVVENRPLGNGTIDRTGYAAARTITLGLVVADDPSTRQALLDQLAPYLYPAARPWLGIATDPLAPLRWYQVRATDLSGPWEQPEYLRATVGFVTAGLPWGQSGDLHTVNVWPGTGAGGRTYNLAFDRVYPSALPDVAVAYNAGAAPAPWTATIYGPVTAPRLDNLTTGQAIVTTSKLVVAAGDWVVIDSTARTLMADGVSSRYYTLDFTQTEWFTLVPGQSRLTVHGTDTQTPAMAVITWRDAYL